MTRKPTPYIRKPDKELTREEMIAQGIPWLSSEAWGELKRLTRYEMFALPVDSDSYQELLREGFIEAGETIGDWEEVTATPAGHDYFKRFKLIYP